MLDNLYQPKMNKKRLMSNFHFLQTKKYDVFLNVPKIQNIIFLFFG